LLNQFAEFANDGVVISDAFLGHVNGGDAGGVRFDFFDFVAIEFAQAFKAVGIAAFPQSFKTREFVRSGGDDDFPALFVGDLVLAAEGEHLLQTTDGELGFVRTRFVIEAGVEDAAVVAGLVLAKGLFFF